jgi:hypothetical protein
MVQIIFNKKSDGINILSEYFRKLNAQELKYYLENNENLSIPIFFQNNTYEPEDIELKNLFFKHLKIVTDKIFYIITELNYIKNPIGISFISNLIHWDNLFVIENNIFISSQYLISVFESIEYNKYTSVDDVYIDGEEIFDIKLLKNISRCIYSILQNSNPDEWIDFIMKKFDCGFIPLSDIVFKNKYNFLREPNVNFIQDKITIYSINSLDPDNFYGTFNSISSIDNTFSPYWEQKIIKLSYSYKNNTYIEIDLSDKDKFNIEKKFFIEKIVSNPFEHKSNQITDGIIYG